MSASPVATYRGTSVSGQHWVLELHQDSDIESPRISQENLGTLIYAHRRYQLGDERITEGSMEEYLARRNLSPDKIVSLPVYLYDHSGLAMSTKPFSCPWDSGCVGAIYATFDKIEEEYGNHDEDTLEKVRDVLRAEISEMHQYLSGDAYGFRAYTTETPEGPDQEDGPEISVWGFFGSDPRTNGMIDHLPNEAVQALEPAIAAEHGRLPAPAPSESTDAAPRAPRPR